MQTLDSAPTCLSLAVMTLYCVELAVSGDSMWYSDTMF